MPSWKIHDKWAEKMGIPVDYSKKVNEIIDFSKEGHDRAMRDLDTLIRQCSKLREEYGDDRIVKVFFLHLYLDEMARFMHTCLIHRGHKEPWKNINADDVVTWSKALRSMWTPMGYDKIFKEVNDFIERNRGDIFSDIKDDILRKHKSA
ncbi:MAG: hypothetical protein KAT65_25905 [Methanophagales archaeon]|nr:hypothetical protein [Methanophagales archaeon]